MSYELDVWLQDQNQIIHQVLILHKYYIHYSGFIY